MSKFRLGDRIILTRRSESEGDWGIDGDEFGLGGAIVGVIGFERHGQPVYAITLDGKPSDRSLERKDIRRHWLFFKREHSVWFRWYVTEDMLDKEVGPW